MIEDYKMELTSNPGLGQAVTADAYGGNPMNIGVGTDPAVGEPLQALFQVTQDFATLTSLTMNVVADDDGAGTNQVVLATSGAVAAANLTVAKGVQRLGGIIPPQLIAKKFLSVQLDVGGSNATAGKVRVWLKKGADVVPVNAGAL